MGKQDMINQIASRFSQMGISFQVGNGADITVAAEFLDAGWSTGGKKISYEASIFADESSNTVFMWEMTKETGFGLSFGGEGSSSFQSGKSLFRKVKSVQYGPDGKAYEYTLDLGAIPKAVKEAAKLSGWKFKTVINKNKAVYPAGYMPAFTAAGAFSAGQAQDAQIGAQPSTQQGAQPISGRQGGEAAGRFCMNCGAPLPPGAKFCEKCGSAVGSAPLQGGFAAFGPHASGQPQYQPQMAPAGPFKAEAMKKSGRKGGAFGLIGFLILGALLVFLLIEQKAAPTGWAVSLGIFLIAFIMQRLLSKRGCLLHFILWILTALALLIAMSYWNGGEISFTTARLKNACMTTATDSSGRPVDKVSAYAPSAPQFVAAAELRNAPPNTRIKYVWKYVTSDVLIAEYVLDSGSSDANVYVFGTLTNNAPWPEGKYKVEMYIEGRTNPDAAVEFEVKSSAGNSSGNKAQSQVLPASANAGGAPAFKIDYLFYELWPSFRFGSATGALKDVWLAVDGDITFSLKANPAGFSTPSDEVSKISAKIIVLKPPTVGAVKLYRFQIDKVCSPNTPDEMKKYSLPMEFDIPVVENYKEAEKPENYLISFSKSINFSQIRIFYCIENLMKIDPKLINTAVSVAKSKGITSNELRSKIGVELIIVMKSGEKHRVYFEREMMPGDFYGEKRLSVEENYQGEDTPIFSQKVD